MTIFLSSLIVHLLTIDLASTLCCEVWPILDVSNDQFGCFFQLQHSSVNGHKVKEEHYSFDVHMDKEHLIWQWISFSGIDLFGYIGTLYVRLHLFSWLPLCLLWRLLVVAKIYLRPLWICYLLNIKNLDVIQVIRLCCFVW